MKVLLIEDEPQIADLVREGLSARGAEMPHCENGHSGFDEAASGRNDVIVLDIMLPGRDGLSVLQGLRRKPRTPVPPRCAWSRQLRPWPGTPP